MPIEHMVWIRFNPGVDDRRVNEHLEALASLAETVPVVRSLRIGPNVTDRAQGFTHGLIVTLDDREALATDQDHPNHVKVAAPLKQDAALMAMDIELS